MIDRAKAERQTSDKNVKRMGERILLSVAIILIPRPLH